MQNMSKETTKQIGAARDMITSLLYELRKLAESENCDAEELEVALKEVENSLSLTKKAFILAGHRSGIGDSNADHNPYTSDGRPKKILCVELKKFYDSPAEAHRGTGVNSGNIYKAATGEIRTAGGYHWMYIDPDLAAKGMIKERSAEDE